MLNKLLFLFALVFVLGSAGASATQSDTLWHLILNHISDTHLSPSGDTIISLANNAVNIIETSTGTLLKSTNPNINNMFRFVFFHHSPKIMIQGEDSAYIWDYERDTILSSFSNYILSPFAISQTDSILLIGYGSRLYKYDLVRNAFIDTIYTSGGIDNLAISNDDRYFAIDASYLAHDGTTEYDRLFLRNFDNMQVIKNFDIDSTLGVISDIRFSPDSKYIGISKYDGTVRVYRTDSLDLYRNIFIDSIYLDAPRRICFSNNSQYIYACIALWNNNGGTKVWNINNNNLIYTYPASGQQGFDVAPNENILVSSSVAIVLLAPKWLSVSDPPQESNEHASGFIISKSGNQSLNIQNNCRCLESCRLYDVFGNLLTNENILSIIDNGNISINPAELGTGVYFLVIGIERVVKVMVVE